jgi:beta-lactamase regulating signal transducer with metallopeptidase domain
MNTLLLYLCESGISIALFYIVYLVFLRKETFFSLNRFYITGAMIISLLIPIIDFSDFFSKSLKVTNMYISKIGNIAIYPGSLKNVVDSQLNSLQYSDFLITAYFAGVGILLIRTIFQFVQLANLIKYSEIKKKGKVNIVLTETKNCPFSVFNFIILNKSDASKKDTKNILAHELIHIRQLHSIDLLIMELLIFIQWFNPFVWLIKRSLLENHEYCADSKVLGQGVHSATYQLSLLRKAVGESNFILANSFNRSLIKKRINMMAKEKSKTVARLKVFLILPVVLFLIFVFSNSQSKNAFNPVVLSNSVSGVQDKIYSKADVEPEFPGGKSELLKCIFNNVKYPDEAKNAGFGAKITVNFVVDEIGTVTNINATKIDAYYISKDASFINKKGNKENFTITEKTKGQSEKMIALFFDEAIRIVKSLQNFKPGLVDGNPVKVKMEVPITFKLK